MAKRVKKSSGDILGISTLREIKGSLGRFISIMAIIALGVGFFAGIRITTPVFIHTVDEYYREHHLFDLRVLSTIGWEEEDVRAYAHLPGVISAEGANELDVSFAGADETDPNYVLKVHSMPDKINNVNLIQGRFPEKSGECLLDMGLSPLPAIGDKLIVDKANKKETLENLAVKELTVVGYVNSPLYINYERGTTSIGNGQIAGFMYVLPRDFAMDVYTGIYLDLDLDGQIYSGTYKDGLASAKKEIEEFTDTQLEKRYDRLFDDTDSMLGMAAMINVLLQMEELSDIEDLRDPESYVLDRGSNVAYASFESDAQIVEQIAKVFPVFFIMVAVLVCITTMSRMIEEQRTLIGTFKAMGFSDARITFRYMGYSGSAALAGCLFGYLTGTYVFPLVIWTAYRMMYHEIALRYIWSTPLFLVSIAASFFCSLGATWAVLRVELSSTAAMLMRPRAPKAGKRVIMEYIPFIWKRLRFMQKISIRNIFRYKGRFLMMVMGIGGCTALLLTGLGIRDTVSDFAQIQYDEIQYMDAELVFRNTASGEMAESLKKLLDRETSEYMLLHASSWDLILSDRTKSTSLVAPVTFDGIDSYMDFHTVSGGEISFPGLNQAIICNGLSDKYDIRRGDIITLRDEDMREMKLIVTGIFENLVYDYIYITPETMTAQLEEEPEINCIYLNFPEDADIYGSAASLSDHVDVMKTVVFKELKERLANMMKSLDYVVIVVIICAAGLAFIVLYDLTNINITERLREIATIKVLGFFEKETSDYVFRENTALTAIGIVVGLGLGVLLHRYVVGEIVVDMVAFKVRILPQSFVYSIVLTFIFNFIVNLVMRRRLDEINMAESLKSVE